MLKTFFKAYWVMTMLSLASLALLYSMDASNVAMISLVLVACGWGLSSAYVLHTFSASSGKENHFSNTGMIKSVALREIT